MYKSKKNHNTSMEKEQLKRDISKLIETISRQVSASPTDLESTIIAIETLYKKTILLDYMEKQPIHAKMETVVHTTVTTKIGNTSPPPEAEIAPQEVPLKAVPPTAPPTHKSDFKGKLSINDRFLFAKQLFGNNSANFENAVNEINSCKTKSELKILTQGYASSYNWDLEDETTLRFIAISNGLIS
jgi:hypothetical protein